MTKWILSFIAMGLICALVLDVLLILVATLTGHLLGFDERYLIILINIVSFPLGFLVSYRLWPPPRRSLSTSIGKETATPLHATKPQISRRWMLIAGGVVLAFTVLAFLVLPRGKTEWRTVGPSDGSFTVLMPGSPQETSTYATTTYTTNMAYGKVKVNMLMLTKGQWCYSISWVDYPEGTQRNPKAALSLDDIRDSIIEGVQGSLLGEEHVQIQGFPGRKLRVQPATPQATLLMKILIVGDRLYQNSVVCPKEKSFSPVISKFLDSFKLEIKAK